MKESYFMGIDTGTNSSKGVLINSHGEIIAEHTTEHAMTNPAPGHYDCLLYTSPSPRDCS